MDRAVRALCRRAHACSTLPRDAAGTRASSRRAVRECSRSIAMRTRSRRSAGVAGVETRMRRSRGRAMAARWRSASTRSSSRTTCTGRCSRPSWRHCAPTGRCSTRRFAAGNERFGRPSNPAFLLEPGELLHRSTARLARRRVRAGGDRAHRAARSCSGSLPSAPPAVAAAAPADSLGPPRRNRARADQGIAGMG